MIKILWGTIGLIAGIFAGLALLYLLASSPLTTYSSIYKTLGINKPQIIGFLPYWLLERADKDFSSRITTLTYFGLILDSDGSIKKLNTPQEEEPGWRNLKSEKLKKILLVANQKGIRTSLLVQNGNEDSIKELISKPQENAQKLISDIKPLMQKYGFTDLNLDVESFLESSPSAQRQFTSFAKEVKLGLEKNNLGTLTIEISPSVFAKSFLISPKEIGETADYIVIMAYDYHYSGSYISGPVAPLGGINKVREFDVETGLKEALKIIPKEKIILGIPLYGYEWETLDSQPGAPTIPGGGATASNRRISKLINECKDCKVGYDEISQEEYVIFLSEDKKYYHQIFFPTEKSMAQKLDLAAKYKIKGVALWALGYEGDSILNPLSAYKQTFEITW